MSTTEHLVNNGKDFAKSKQLPKLKKKKKLSNGAKVVTNGATVNHHASSSNVSRQDSNESSIARGRDAFKHLLSGIDVKTFMTENWEKHPIYIDRNSSAHYDYLQVSTEAIDDMMRNNMIEFTKNLDVTSYENGVRETHNPDGRALPGTVWSFYRDGCSIRK